VLAGYWPLKDLGLPAESYEQFSRGNSTFLSVTVNVPFSVKGAQVWGSKAQNIINELAADYLDTGARATLLGIPAFIPVMLHDIEIDLGEMDAIVLPISFLLFLLMVKSIRLLCLPIVGVMFSLCFTFAGSTIISYFLPVMSFIPSLLMSLCSALSFDYSLFLGIRLREELLRKKVEKDEFVQVVAAVFSTSGHTIFISGVILMLTFLTMVFFPVKFIVVTGICAALSIFFNLCVNLVLVIYYYYYYYFIYVYRYIINFFSLSYQVPSVLLCFPNFFMGCVEPFSICGKRFTYGTRPVEEEQDEDNMRDSNWYRLGFLNTRLAFSLLFIFVCIAIVAPLSYFAITYTASDSLLQDLPRGAAVTESYSRFSESFGPGFVYPTQLLVRNIFFVCFFSFLFLST
jgi:uncharacterized membrane protein YdfJ with MMPL/SSD domain